MTQLYTFGILMLMAGAVLEVSTFPSSNEFYRGAQWKHEGRWREYEYRKPPDVYIYNGMDFQEAPLNLDDTTYTLFLRPIAYAKSFKGSAIANPISEVIIAKGRTGTIVHAPVATAVAGPGGIAHAQSDLYLYEYVSE